MEATELIEKIKKILLEYENEQSIHKLLSLYERLALNLVFLWEEEASLKFTYNVSYYSRKIAVSHSYISNKAEKMTEQQSIKTAERDNEELLKTELENEALLQRLHIFRMQGNKVLEALRTRISFEKWELQRTRTDDII